MPRKLTYEEVQQAFEARGYTLFSTGYVGALVKLDYKCPRGHFGSITYGSFYQGKGCPVCVEHSYISKISQKWLDSLCIPNIMGVNREVRLKVGNAYVRVDGFKPESKTAYEFLGDYWHGNPARFNPCDVNEYVGKTYGQLYQETLDRFSLLEQAGYNLVYIWEADFLKQKKQKEIYNGKKEGK